MGRQGVTNNSSTSSSGSSQTSNATSSSAPPSPSTASSSSFCRISLGGRPKPLRVMVLGQAGVGKSALVVRFITRRYIGEYDPNLEKVYTFHTVICGEPVSFEILDTAGQPNEGECVRLEANIRWAEAFVLMYSVTDKCSFDECNRLKFLINYNKRRRNLRGRGRGSTGGKDVTSGWSISAPWNPWHSSSHFTLGSSSHSVPPDAPVVALVGNKTDAWGERMVSVEEGERRSRDIGCACFHEISVRENVDESPGLKNVCHSGLPMHLTIFYRCSNKWLRTCSELVKREWVETQEVISVFQDIVRFSKIHQKFPKLKRSTSDLRAGDRPNPDAATHLTSPPSPSF